MKLIPAAQYLRMSTEHQQYSTENQSSAIAAYATAKGFEIVKTYSDAARSGVVLRNRFALQQLLKDILGQPPFKAILVYDVSRWGRFQDTDEAAHYEYLCKSAGIPVHYCAEQFTSQGTIADLILKNVKRVMAAEFSRELGDKMIPAKKRLARMGYLMGGSVPYGTRRMLISADGKRKQILKFGEYKSVSTDRVILVPGPKREVQTVRLMFRLVRDKSLTPEEVAEFLNAAGVSYIGGRRWMEGTVRNMLRNPKYIGMNVWGRTTCRLYARPKPAPREDWAILESAFRPIVDWHTFNDVQSKIKARRWTDAQLIGGLKDVLRKGGVVTQNTLLHHKGAPAYNTVASRFGSFAKALELIGYRRKRDASAANRRATRSRRLHARILDALLKDFPARLMLIRKPRSSKHVMLFDGKHVVAVLLGMPRLSSFGKISWRVIPQKNELGIPAVCFLLTEDRKNVRYTYVVSAFPNSRRSFELKPDGKWLQGAQRVARRQDLCNTLSAVIRREQTDCGPSQTAQTRKSLYVDDSHLSSLPCT